MIFDIYEEGFCINGGSAQAHYIGCAHGKTFLDACKNYIKEHPNSGEIRKDYDGNQFACNWGCRWFPSLSEAQKSFG